MPIGDRIGGVPAVVLAACCLLSAAPAPAVPVTAPAAPPVHARAAYLLNISTGKVGYAKRAGRRMPVASLTKVMTAHVVLREARLRDTITITSADVRYAAVNGAMHAGLRAGERLTVKDLLYALMLRSGADAAHALARRYGPGRARFVAKMNDTARALGLFDTRYTNPDGLPHPGGGGHSTAEDQVRLAGSALANPLLRRISSTERHVLPRAAGHRRHVWENTNKLLGTTPGAIGVKTGYTRAAGFCLLFAAERGGHLLIGALLGETQPERRFTTARRLLAHAAKRTAR